MTVRIAAVLPLLAAIAAPATAAQSSSAAQSAPAAQSVPVAQPTAQETRLEQETSRVASQLRCPVCQGLSIEDSPSDMARDMRGIVREQLAEGKSPEEVKEYFVRGYGEWILLEPRPEGFNLAVYILPIILLLGGATLIVVLTRRWSRATPTSTTLAAEDPDLAAWDDVSRG